MRDGRRCRALFIAKGVAGLRRTSVVLAHQVATVDRGYLDGMIGVVPQTLMSPVDRALRLVLGP